MTTRARAFFSPNLRRRNVLFPLLILFLVVSTCAPGCRRRKIPGLVPATGVVTYEGIPLAWATLTFAPEEKKGKAAANQNARVSTAMTNQNGEFILGTLGLKGALPGEYEVTVEKYIADGDDAVEKWENQRKEAGYSEPAATEDVFDVVSAIPLKYSNKKTSGIKIVIPEKGSKELSIELGKD